MRWLRRLFGAGETYEKRARQIDRRIERSEDMLRRASSALERAQEIEARVRLTERQQVDRRQS